MATAIAEQVSVGDIVRSVKQLEAKIGRSSEEIVRFRFRQGCMLKTVYKNTEYGEQAIEEIADEVGVSSMTLYRAYHMAKAFEFEESKLSDYILELERNKIKPTLSYIDKKLLKSAKNPEVVGGLDKHKEIACKDIERLAERIEDANETYKDDPEVQGAVQGALEVLDEAREWLAPDNTMKPISKEKPFRSKLWRQIICSLPCAYTSKTPVDPHHIVSKGRNGNHAHDFWCIPLSRELHDMETKQEGYLLETYGKDPRQALEETLPKAFRALEEWLESKGVTEWSE